ncbi:hypothetical protein H5S09_02885 [Limosilactobacillus sp. STM2_1]|uniref:Uncharacterized protein n=1 Tax=Limosilactobacillus rudii TaxID=2759755 RepID=A0A7W3UJU2_9LACO|nr:hypothetical protein [Limosilactobacillus rudii]MBB1080200.1 hypothetical protein [Limosilactobacillus rudii]MBB1096896.1 hypothetical protein [Limosilactobacillus rudii]MCD7133794.1 hypothetical protein [Limosilactobacillus rudii]
MQRDFEKEDFILLDTKLEEALKQGKTTFKIHMMAFDEVPNYEQHINKYERLSKYRIRHVYDGGYYVFHIEK